MEFSETRISFSKSGEFTDSMKRFISEEAAIFSKENGKDATSSMDKTAEKLVRLSADKSKVKLREKKKILNEIQDNPKSSDDKDAGKTSEKFTEVASANHKDSKQVQGKTTSKEVSKEISREKKKAATKTAVANMLKAKADVSGELASDKVTGDALKDGNKGLVKTFLTVINPMTYVKKWIAGLIAYIAPYLFLFTTILAVVCVLVVILFGLIQPMTDVGNALNGFVGMFSGDGGGLRNLAFSSDEIEEIVAQSGADETQSAAIRFALSKVGYPYSQAARTSGSAYDCSSLAYYSWESAGVDISFGQHAPPTAAGEAKVLETNGKKVGSLSLMPGDLIFYGGHSNGRYMGIYHVAIYVGNGMAVEALNEEYGVVYQKLRTKNACMICRPNM